MGLVCARFGRAGVGWDRLSWVQPRGHRRRVCRVFDSWSSSIKVGSATALVMYATGSSIAGCSRAAMSHTCCESPVHGIDTVSQVVTWFTTPPEGCGVHAPGIHVLHVFWECEPHVALLVAANGVGSALHVEHGSGGARVRRVRRVACAPCWVLSVSVEYTHVGWQGARGGAWLEGPGGGPQ